MFALLERIKKALTPADRFIAAREAVKTLITLSDELNGVVDRLHHRESDAVTEIVTFFDAVSRVQDSGVIERVITELRPDPRFTPLISDLEVLQLHLKRAGRDSYGMNRTKPGQRVTDHDVFLVGGINARITRTVAYIKTHRADTSYYDEMSVVALGFMNDHIKPMLSIVSRFRRVIEPAMV